MQQQMMDNKRLTYILIALIFLAYLLPTFIQTSFTDDLGIEKVFVGLPGVLSGDEPHYMTLTNSFVFDSDFFIDNNHDNAYKEGKCDAGFRFKSNNHVGIGRHIQLINPEQKKVVTMDTFRSKYNEDIQTMYDDLDIQNHREISNRPAGIAFFTGSILKPLSVFEDSCIIEHAAIYLNLIFSFIGLFFFYKIIRHYAGVYKDKLKNYINYPHHTVALFTTAIFALTSPYWYYSKTYWAEVPLMVLFITTYYLFVIKKQTLLPGLLVGLGTTIKYPFGMYLIIISAILIYRKQLKEFIIFGVASSIPLSFTLWYNYTFSGSIFPFGQTAVLGFGNYIVGFLSWMINPRFGLLTATPVLIFSIFGLYKLCKDKKTKSLGYTLALCILPYLLFWTSYAVTQTGAGGFSARYLVPIISLLYVLLFFWYGQNNNPYLKKLFLLLLLLSCIINFLAAFLYFIYWDATPWILLEKLTEDPERIIEMVKGIWG